jgi:hypothetical protein
MCSRRPEGRHVHHTPAGLLILAAFLTYGSGVALATFVVDVTDPLAGVAAHPLRFSVGAALMLANSAVVAGIGVLLFPVVNATTSGLRRRPQRRGADRLDGPGRRVQRQRAMESFFTLLQENVLDRQRWTSGGQLKLAIITWIEQT